MTPPAQEHDHPLAITLRWDAHGLACAFLGRAGVLNGSRLQNFDLSERTEWEHSARDWERWRAAWPGLVPVRVHQVHGTEVVAIAGAPHQVPSADGMVTARSGIALCIFTADCAPILMADPANHVIGALHAGWRGTLANIAQAGIRAMVAQGAHPEQIQVAIGPTIGLCCFEVDVELAARFYRAPGFRPEHSWPGREGKAYLDLRGILRRQFLDCGIAAPHITVEGPCTKCEARRYFSRRASGGVIAGLQMSFIGYQE